MSRERKEVKDLLKRAYDAPNNVRINFCLVGDKYPVEKFVEGLDEKDQNEIVALFMLFGENKGKIFNEQKYKKLGDSVCGAIFEFKAYQVRIACFSRPGYNYNLIYGFKKKRGKWPKSDLKNMNDNCSLFFKEEEKRKKVGGN